MTNLIEQSYRDRKDGEVVALAALSSDEEFGTTGKSQGLASSRPRATTLKKCAEHKHPETGRHVIGLLPDERLCRYLHDAPESRDGRA